MTQPNAQSAAAAVYKAHEDAGLGLDEPVLISSHGTGTLLNDRSEAAALREVYGRRLDQSRIIATKSSHGHMLGATGAIEFLLGIKALTDRVAPPIANFLGADPDCDLPLALTPEPIDYRTLVSTSFAFGGLNSALIAHLP
jgi:nodulation protein E